MNIIPTVLHIEEWSTLHLLHLKQTEKFFKPGNFSSLKKYIKIIKSLEHFLYILIAFLCMLSDIFDRL